MAAPRAPLFFFVLSPDFLHLLFLGWRLAAGSAVITLTCRTYSLVVSRDSEQEKKRGCVCFNLLWHAVIQGSGKRW